MVDGTGTAEAPICGFERTRSVPAGASDSLPALCFDLHRGSAPQNAIVPCRRYPAIPAKTAAGASEG